MIYRVKLPAKKIRAAQPAVKWGTRENLAELPATRWGSFAAKTTVVSGKFVSTGADAVAIVPTIVWGHLYELQYSITAITSTARISLFGTNGPVQSVVGSYIFQGRPTGDDTNSVGIFPNGTLEIEMILVSMDNIDFTQGHMSP